MMKAENISSMVTVVDTIAASANIPAKIVGKEFIEYWKIQMEKDPHLRNILEEMTPEEMEQTYGPDQIPNTGDEPKGLPNEVQNNQQQVPPEEAQQVPQQPQEEVETKTEVKSRNTSPKADTKEEEEIRSSFA